LKVVNWIFTKRQANLIHANREIGVPKENRLAGGAI
jgi:hypothetical protein